MVLSLLPLAAGCKKDNDIDDERRDDDMNLTFNIDWKDLPEPPSGLTLRLFPSDGSEPLTYTYDAVNQVSLDLKQSDYSLLCFNQTEADFKGYTFNLDSFEDATVVANDPSNLEPLAVATIKTLAETRGMNLKIAVLPNNIVKGMSISVQAEGVTDRSTITGRLSNMATGIKLATRKPLANTTDQVLPPEVWDINVPTDASKPTTLTATFSTLGVFLADEDFPLANGTRAAFDDIETRNILHVTITKEDQTVIEQEYDVTEEVVEQYIAALEAEAAAVEPDTREYVDLALPSGTLWATCNVGASQPEKYGKYYAWGETEPKFSYEWSNYQYCNGSSTTLTKYCSDSRYGRVDSLSVLMADDDAATINWGIDWCTPSRNQFDELINSNYTTQKFTTRNGVNGWLITSRQNQNSIFLPATGYGYSGPELVDGGKQGAYMTSELCITSPQGAKALHFTNDNIFASEDEDTNRFMGRTVRPVRRATTQPVNEVVANAFFPYGLEDYTVMAWYAWSGKTTSGGEKVIAVYLFSDNLYVTTVRKVENGVETRAIESAGAYILTGDYNNGSATIYVEEMENSTDSIAKTMSAKISNGVMTVFDGTEQMSEQFTRQNGPVPTPSLPSEADDDFAQEAFFPESYASKNIAAWYAWSEFNYEKMDLKVLAVFLFDDNTFVTTKRKISSKGDDERVIESSGTYSIHTGNYSNGGAYIMAAAGGGDSIMMTADIVNGVMTVYQNGEAMQERFTRQYSPAPEASSATVVEEGPIQEEEEYGFEAVDLGLSVMWASANVGAESPEAYGDFFAPGETKAKDLYSWSNYKYGTSADNLTKYNEKDTLSTLTADDDAATANLGSQWRTPTVEEWTALKDSCEWIWSLQNDVAGYLVIGQNGNSIFLPAAGMKYDDKWPYEGEQGEYMSSSLVQTYVWATEFTAKDINTYAAGSRNYGMPVRAVRSY